MTKVKAGAGVATLALALVSPAWGFSGSPQLDLLSGRQAATVSHGTTLETATKQKKRARSCNKGDDNRKGQAAAAVDAWAVACEFPPRSQTIPSAALQNAAAAVAMFG